MLDQSLGRIEGTARFSLGRRHQSLERFSEYFRIDGGFRPDAAVFPRAEAVRCQQALKDFAERGVGEETELVAALDVAASEEPAVQERDAAEFDRVRCARAERSVQRSEEKRKKDSPMVVPTGCHAPCEGVREKIEVGIEPSPRLDK